MRARVAAGALRLWLRFTGRLPRAGPPDLEELLRPELRLLEVGSRDFRLSSALRARGHPRLLALALLPDAASLARVRARHPALAEVLLRCERPQEVAENSAEVLALSDPAALRHLRRHRRAQHVMWIPPAGLAGAGATLAFVREALRGRSRGLRLLGPALFRDEAGRERLALVAENRGRKEGSARRHVPAALGVERFFRELEAGGVRYVVLRWFDALPQLPPGEDLDLLVADADVPAAEELLARGPGLVPLDLYSASGLPGTAYRRMACYPPAIAARILEEAEVPRAPYRVPSPPHHFLSLAYHAVYHKGEASGIPSHAEGIAPAARPDHDYAGVLASLARRLGVRVAIRLEALDEHLAGVGWRPPLDALARLARRNAWLAQRVARLVAERPEPGPPGLVVFLVRRRALELGFEREIEALVEEAGFEVLARVPLGPEASARVARGARGGNWERGPYPRCGGPPALALVAYDPAPIAPRPDERTRHPGLENARVLVKARIRDRLNARLPEAERCNLLHSSDHAWGALEYLRLAAPEATPQLLVEVTRRREGQGSSNRRVRAG